MSDENILILDQGNSRIKWGLYNRQGGDLKSHGVVERVDQLTRSLSGIDPAPVWYCSVADHEQSILMNEWFRQNWRCKCSEVSVEAETLGIRNCYQEPGSLGVDRWMAMLGAAGRQATNFVVIDAGSAITVDFVDDQSKHRGGVIMPGYRTMLNSLNQSTTLQCHQSERVETGLGCDTGSAIQAGLGYAISGLSTLLEELVGPIDGVKVFLAGGDALRVAQLLKYQCEIREHLVLEGVLRVVNSRYA